MRSDTTQTTLLPTVFVLIPVHNGISHTVRCLEALENQTYPNKSVVLIDDGSTDGTSQLVKKRFPKVTILSGDGTLWWTGAMNMGLRYVLHKAASTDFVLTLNNDVTFEPQFIESMVSVAKLHPGYIVGPLCMDADEPDRVVNSGWSRDWKSGKVIRYEYDPNLDYRTGLNALPGYATLIPVQVFHKVGFFDQKHFPHYGADHELAQRAINGGFKLMICYRARIYVNTKVTGLKISPTQRIGYRMLYRLFFDRKSLHNLQNMFNGIRFRCPARYKPLNYALFVLNTLNYATNITPFHQLKRPLFALLKRVYKTGNSPLVKWQG